MKPVPKKVRNKMAQGGKAQRKAYAYGSTVRSAMNADTSANSTMNPMMPRAQQGMMSAPMPTKMKGMAGGGRAYGKNEMGMINARLGHAVESLISNTDSDKPDSKLTKDSIKRYVNDIKLAVETGIAEAAGFSDAKIKQALRRATK